MRLHPVCRAGRQVGRRWDRGIFWIACPGEGSGDGSRQPRGTFHVALCVGGLPRHFGLQGGSAIPKKSVTALRAN